MEGLEASVQMLELEKIFIATWVWFWVYIYLVERIGAISRETSCCVISKTRLLFIQKRGLTVWRPVGF